MKSILATAVIFAASFAGAQITISPVSVQYAKRASDQITLTNGGLTPVVATLSAKTLGVTPDRHAAILPLDKDTVVKLHDISGRIEPNTSRTFDVDVKCKVRCVTMIVATITPVERHEKNTTPDDEVHTGMRLQLALGSVWYVCPKERGCRDSFKEIWSAPR